jgi:MATE family multidrug resistance protein
MGLEGAGLATVIARGVMMCCMLGYVVRCSTLRPFLPARWKIPMSSEWIRRLLRLGWPVAVQHLLEITAFVVAALMMGWISANAMAAHQIAVTSATASWVVALGVGIAACIRVGHAWGAGRWRRVRRIGFLGLGMAVLIMGGFALLFVLAGGPIARLFIESQAVVALAAQLLLLAGLFQVADGVQVVAISALRGLADVRAVPLCYGLAFLAGWGPRGIWAGLAIGLGTAAVCLSWRFHRLTRSHSSSWLARK